MKRFFTVTSPTNALAVTIYGMLAFYAWGFLFGKPNGPIEALGDVWSTVLLISSSAAVLVTLSSPRMRDPDKSLIIEFWACAALCTLVGWLQISLWFYRTSDGTVAWNLMGATLIFFVGFLARAIQIRHDRKALRKFRANGPTVH